MENVASLAAAFALAILSLLVGFDGIRRLLNHLLPEMRKGRSAPSEARKQIVIGSLEIGILCVAMVVGFSRFSTNALPGPSMEDSRSAVIQFYRKSDSAFRLLSFSMSPSAGNFYEISINSSAGKRHVILEFNPKTRDVLGVREDVNPSSSR